MSCMLFRANVYRVCRLVAGKILEATISGRTWTLRISIKGKVFGEMRKPAIKWAKALIS